MERNASSLVPMFPTKRRKLCHRNTTASFLLLRQPSPERRRRIHFIGKLGKGKMSELGSVSTFLLRDDLVCRYHAFTIALSLYTSLTGKALLVLVGRKVDGRPTLRGPAVLFTGWAPLLTLRFFTGNLFACKYKPYFPV